MSEGTPSISENLWLLQDCIVVRAARTINRKPLFFIIKNTAILTVGEADTLILPYQALKCFLIEYNLNGFLPDNYRDLVLSVNWQ